MKNVKFFFAVLIICILSSCIDVDKSLGLDFVPDHQSIKLDYYEFDLPAYTAALDSVITSSTENGVFGYMNVAPFGAFTAGSVFRMLPYTQGFTYEAGAILDSAMLFIPLSNRTLSKKNETINQSLLLCRLNRDLQYNTAYYNNSLKESDYDPIPLNENYIYKGEDTLIIHMKPAFIQELMNFTEEQTSNDTIFLQTLKGFYLKVDTTAAQAGQVSYFNLSKIYLRVNYHHAEEDSARAFYYYTEIHTPNFNTYAHSSSVLANPQPDYEIYMEGLAGVKPCIDFQAVKDTILNLLDRKGNSPSKLVINKAELQLQLKYPPFSMEHPSEILSLMENTPGTLTLAYKADSTYNFITDTYLSTFGGTVNRSLYQYSLNVTYFTQGLFTPHTYADTSSKLYLYPLLISQDAYGSEVRTLEKIKYSFGILKGYQDKGVKLKLTYTILK